MKNDEHRSIRKQTLALSLSLAATLLMATASATFAQRLPGTENGEWHHYGGDLASSIETTT